MNIKTIVTVVVVSAMFLSNALSAATLSIHTSGAVKQDDYLCIYDVGCFNLKMASEGKAFNLDNANLTQLKKLALVNMTTHALTTTVLDTSCNVAIKDNQHLTINVNVASNKNQHVTTINHAVCKITG